MPHEELGLSKEARKEIERLVRKYAIGIGLVLLGLNIVAGTSTVLVFWSYVYKTAKDDYMTRSDILIESNISKFNTLHTELVSQNNILKESLKKEIGEEFDSSFIKKKAVEILNEAIDMSKNAHHALDTATNKSNDITLQVQVIKEKVETAENLTNKTLKNAKESSTKIDETFNSFQNENKDFAELIVFMRDLKKQNSPLESVGKRLTKIEDAFSIDEKSITFKKPINSFSVKGPLKVDHLEVGDVFRFGAGAGIMIRRHSDPEDTVSLSIGYGGNNQRGKEDPDIFYAHPRLFYRITGFRGDKADVESLGIMINKNKSDLYRVRY